MGTMNNGTMNNGRNLIHKGRPWLENIIWGMINLSICTIVIDGIVFSIYANIFTVYRT